MHRKLLIMLATLLLAGAWVAACGGGSGEVAQGTPVASLGQVQLNAHPQSLQGKTIVLRWNGKPNGDKLLTRVAELLSGQYHDAKVVKLWESDADTAVSSDGLEVSGQITEKIAAYNPDLVIASQCD